MKNALRAVIERHPDLEDYPPIRVIVREREESIDINVGFPLFSDSAGP